MKTYSKLMSSYYLVYCGSTNEPGQESPPWKETSNKVDTFLNCTKYLKNG